jgi:hypothetical protein
MTRRQLRGLVQDYCTEHQVITMWEDNRPGVGWLRKFRQRWAHRIKVRRPTNIKPSRAKVRKFVLYRIRGVKKHRILDLGFQILLYIKRGMKNKTNLFLAYGFKNKFY